MFTQQGTVLNLIYVTPHHIHAVQNSDDSVQQLSVCNTTNVDAEPLIIG